MVIADCPRCRERRVEVYAKKNGTLLWCRACNTEISRTGALKKLDLTGLKRYRERYTRMLTEVEAAIKVRVANELSEVPK